MASASPRPNLRPFAAILCGLLVLPLVTTSLHGAQDPPLNLLRIPAATLEATSVSAGDRAALAALVDGDPGTQAVGAASSESPLWVVYGFRGETIAPEKLVIHLPPTAPEGATVERVEILASSLSPNAGFRLLRADPLHYGSKPGAFEFPSTGAVWIMLRFIPADQSTRVAIAEVELLGREGPPATRYEFKQSPAKALDVLARLKQSAVNVQVTPDEASLFADAADGKLDQWSFGEAALLASGVSEKSARSAYLRRLDAIQQRARTQLAGTKRPFEQGERLLKILHDGPLAQGYEASQTDLSAILDTGKYNCVSSATLYNVIGRQLGLDLRAIEVPDHAFAVLYDGTQHADVETTTADGFNPVRDPAARQKFEQQTGFRYIPDSHRDQRREIGDTGLVAIIYYNHGVELTREKQYPAALSKYFRALSLDPQFASAVKNALATLANWSLDLAKQEKFEESLSVIQTGLDLAPEDRTLVHNHKVIWGDWADATMAGGNVDQALAILRRAAAKLPREADEFQKREAWLFIRGGEQLAKNEMWQEAMTVVETGLAKLTGKPREELTQWRNGIYLRWANSQLDQKRFEQALDVLDRGRQSVQDKRLANNLTFTAQQWVRDVYESQGEEPARTTIVALLKRYPNMPDVQDVGENHVRRVVLGLRDAGKFDEAQAAIQRHAELLSMLQKSEQVQELSASVYDGAARVHMQAHKWDDAVAVYERARTELPEARLIQTNLVYCCQEWLGNSLRQGGEMAAQMLAIALLKRFPQEKGVRDVVQNHAHRVVYRLRDAGKYDEALAAIDRQADLLSALGDAKLAQELAAAVYDASARTHMRDRKWEQAVAVYQNARTRLPESRSIQNNLVFCCQEWLSDSLQQDGEAAAQKLAIAVLERFPQERGVRDVTKNHFRRLVLRLRDQGKFADALAVVDRHQELLSALDDKRAADEAVEAVYDGWARTFFDKDWPKAIEIYQMGLKRVPKSALLANNLKYCQQQAQK